MIAVRINEQRADPHTSQRADTRVSLARRRARQALVERYLLGRLDEGARAVLRATAIENPHAFAEVRETELDLLDALADGTLDRDRARVVDAWIPFGNHDAWSVSQALAERTRPVRPFALVESVGARWRSAARAHPVFSSQLQMWPAAAMLVIAAGLWFARNPSAPPLVGPPIAPAAVIATASSMPAITLHLSDDAAAAPRRMRLAPNASRLWIEVALPSDMPSPVDIAIQSADGRVMWAMRGAPATASIVSLSIPADSLAKGRISLVVTPSDGSRPPRRTSFFLE